MEDILADCIANAMHNVFFEAWDNLDRDWQRITVAELKYMYRNEDWSDRGVRAMVSEFAGRIKGATLREFAESVAHHHN